MTDIEQTPGDRLRFEIILKSLAEGGNNLAILSEHDLVLDFYANLLDERLHTLGGCEVEFCFSTNSERLVQKFNEILGELTVDQALAKEQKQARRRYLVFRDSILMQDFELQLLARLVNGFPASNICVILLINSAGSNRSKLDAFGKTLLQWEVETRAGEPRKPLGDDWVAPPPVEEAPEVLTPQAPPEEALEVAKIITPPEKPSWRIPGFGRKDKTPPPTPAPTPVPSLAAAAPATSSEPLPVPPVGLAAMPSAATFLSGERHAAAASTPSAPSAPATTPSGEPDLWLARTDDVPPEGPAEFARPKRSFPWAILWLVPIVTAGVFAVMYNDLIGQEVESFRKYLLRGTPAPTSQTAAQPATDATASAAAEPAAAGATEGTADKPADPTIDKAADATTLSAPPTEAPATADKSATPAEATPLTPPVAADKPKSAAADTTPTTKVAAVQAAPETPAVSPSKDTKEPKVNPKSDEAWMEQLTPTSHVVQLAAFDTEEEMQAFKRGDPIYAKARVLRVHKKDSTKRYFVLIAGPFASKEDAQSFMQSHPLLAKGWLRSAKSLKAQL
jgi:septal ring-binding cell division protein DamX